MVTNTVADNVVAPRNQASVATDLQQSSAVSWAAVLAGAAAAASLSLILLILGTGLGLTAVSPWAQKGVSASAVGISTIVWVLFTALAASGLGGYLAGRLRIKWATLHTDEVYFRDTAHGFLAWAVATLVTAGLLASAVGSVLSAGTTVAGAAVTAAGAAGAAGVTTMPSIGSMTGSTSDRNATSPYLVDTLFRSVAPAAGTNGPTIPAGGQAMPGPDRAMGDKGEVGRMFANDIGSGSMPPDDLHYAAQLIAQRTGMSQADAEKRVGDAYNGALAKLRQAEAAAKEAADQARKNAAYSSLWIFVSLLLGAFAASLMATYGGRQRDVY